MIDELFGLIKVRLYFIRNAFSFFHTIFPMDTALLKGSGIREFSEEISDIIRPQ